jgi:NAD(P)-dependent dehydrogenase (short-subunit alcohol dehydrogenase family)
LHAAFNNTGVMTPTVETADADPLEFDRVTAINLRGVWTCMKHELAHMREHGGGAIVNCSSIGRTGRGDISHTPARCFAFDSREISLCTLMNT